ncbi:hypothetical protein AWC38_SpisGene21925 [Stylophora pistillata]|uniref:Integrator complex subunit 10 n=1 Tax=Stylophora pistillata TaxID=50429 RepID=A0A2B4R8I9_STYPI|nr:hypothetical protein AWC38_SpisGene21925 [Stylophora pistillata]
MFTLVGTGFVKAVETHVKYTPQTVCLRQYHENIHLICACLSKEVEGFPSYSSTFVDDFVCDSNSEECMLGRCDTCATYIWLDSMLDSCESSLCEPVTWNQWERVEVAKKKKPPKVAKKRKKIYKEAENNDTDHGDQASSDSSEDAETKEALTHEISDVSDSEEESSNNIAIEVDHGLPPNFPLKFDSIPTPYSVPLHTSCMVDGILSGHIKFQGSGIINERDLMSLIGAFPPKKVIAVLDSMADGFVKPNAEASIKEMWTLLKICDSTLDEKEWHFVAKKPSDLPQKANGYDCRVFTSLYVRCLIANNAMFVELACLQDLRKHMVAELHKRSILAISRKFQIGSYSALDYVNKFYIE